MSEAKRKKHQGIEKHTKHLLFATRAVIHRQQQTLQLRGWTVPEP